ncbi:histidine-rich glycoprotein [Podargus strigoides]
MLLLASAFFLTLLQCSNAQTKPGITPADCNTVETDAGVALDLVNRHRRDGYVFGLFRVADAHELHIGNSSVLFLTLDVLETECSVLSRKHWESCEYSDTYYMDFGQCIVITYTSQLLKRPRLYGFNCTLSPVPPDLLECKDCPVKVEVLEVMEQHKNIAAKALKKFNSESNHTNYFDVDKVEKILKLTASREGHSLGFSIKETNCSKSAEQADQALECDFLDDWHAHTGFCKARIISDPDEPDGTDISCEIYHPWQHNYGQRCRYSTQPHRHPHPHHHFGHKHRYRHHPKHHHRHGCPPSSQSRPEDTEHNHNFTGEHQDSHEGPTPPPSPTNRPHHHLHPPPHDEPHHHFHPPHHCPPPPPHGGPHDHPPPPPHDGPHHHFHPPHHCPPPPPHGGPHDHPPPPPHDGPHHHFHPPHHCPPPPPHDEPHSLLQEEPQHPSSAPPPHDESHHPPPSQGELDHLPSPPPPHNEPHNPPLGPHHGPCCPPPHGPHHPHPPPHRRPHCPFPPHGPHHHHPPPPHELHHHHPPPNCGPDCPPPSPHKPHHHHPPHCGPHHHPPPPHGPHHHHPHPGHPHHLHHHYYRHHCNKTSISGKYFPFQITGAVYRIPVLNQQDSLTPPTLNFSELFQSNFHSSSTGEGIPFSGLSLKEIPEALGFPDHPTQSKSCPGTPKLVLPRILPLFPHTSMAENSPT